MRIALDLALLVACFALPFAIRWRRSLRWGLPVRIFVDPDDPRPAAIVGYLAEVAQRLDERPERMRIDVFAANAQGSTVSLDITPGQAMAISVDGHRSKTLDLRHRWIPEHPVPLVLWSRRMWRKKTRLYVEPVDANRFRVMSRVPFRVSAALYVACSILATAGAVLLSGECLAVAAGLALGMAVCARLSA